MHKMFARQNIIKKMQNVNYALRAFFSSDVKEDMVKVGKYNINYIKVGHGGHSCILTPGALGTATSHYTRQVEGFDRSQFTLVLWDPPGYGKSRPPDREVMTKNYESDADIGHELMKILNIPRYSVLGWSAGGSASLIHAAKYSDAVRKLVVWATSAFILPSEIEGYRSIKDVNTWAKHLRAPMEETYGKEKLVQYWRRWVDSMAAGFQADPDICTEHLKNIKCPTSVLHGGRDPLADPTHATYLIQNIEHSVLHMYPEGKHDIHMRYADDFNRRVQDFLLQPTEK